MKIKQLVLIFLLLTLTVTPVYADDFQDGLDAYNRGDYKEAVKWYRLAAEQGDAFAQNNLGLMYDEGHGVPQDYHEAAKWYRLSVEQGYAQAQNNLGVVYDKGKGVSQDYKEAAKWYLLSAIQGYAQAQYNLGWMYAYGKGVTRNYVQAHKWWDILWASGDKEGRMNRDSLEKQMTPAQIAEAQRLAREWMEEHK